MLKGIDNRLNAEVLHALRLMGHGDVLIVADTNFSVRLNIKVHSLWKTFKDGEFKCC